MVHIVDSVMSVCLIQIRPIKSILLSWKLQNIEDPYGPHSNAQHWSPFSSSPWLILFMEQFCPRNPDFLATKHHFIGHLQSELLISEVHMVHFYFTYLSSTLEVVVEDPIENQIYWSIHSHYASIFIMNEDDVPFVMDRSPFGDGFITLPPMAPHQFVPDPPDVPTPSDPWDTMMNLLYHQDDRDLDPYEGYPSDAASID